MKKISERKETNDFIHFLFSLDGHKRFYYSEDGPVKRGLEYILNLNQDDLKSLISDPIWNEYRSWKESDTHGRKLLESEEFCQDRYGGVICDIFKNIIVLNNKLSLFIAKHGEGLILSTIIKNGHGNIINAVGARGLKSKDSRVRNLIAKNGPIKYAKKLRLDKNVSVRRNAIRRLGIQNCYKDHLTDPAKSIRYMAMGVASLEEFDYVKIIESIGAKPKTWSERELLLSIISKLSPEESLFHLDLHGDVVIKKIMENKIVFSNKWKF